MLDTFKAQLNAYLLAKKVNLSQQRKDAFAAKLDKKNPDITEASEHDTAIVDLDELLGFADIAKQDDKVRTLEAKTKPPAAPPNGDDDAEDEPAAPPKKEKSKMPEWFKPYADKMDKIDAKEKAQSVQSKVKESLPTVPDWFYKNWQLPDKDEDYDGFIEKVKTEWEPVSKDYPAQGQQQRRTTHVPQRSSGGTNDGIDPDIKAFAKQKADLAAAAANKQK